MPHPLLGRDGVAGVYFHIHGDKAKKKPAQEKSAKKKSAKKKLGRIIPARLLNSIRL
ncbi:MAG TPA: hypothetical protein VGD95_02145 [Micavibrio sp.]